MAAGRGAASRVVVMLVIASTSCALAAACNVTADLRLPDRGVPGDGGFGANDGSPFGPGADATTFGDGAGAADGALADGAQPPPDGGGAPDAADLCPINPCTGGNVCCYVVKSANSGAYECMPSCPNGEAPNECAGPQQCGGATPVCCATVRLGAGNVPNCAIDGTSSSCTSSCSTNLGLGCGVTDTLRLCHSNGDCAGDPNNPYCCTYNGAGVSSVVCVSGLVKGALNLPCSPN